MCPCEGNIPAFDYNEIHKYLKKVDGWDVKRMNRKIIIYLKNLNLIILLIAKNLLI